MVKEKKSPLDNLSDDARKDVLTRSLSSYKPPQPTLENCAEWEQRFPLSGGFLNTVAWVTINYDSFFRIERQLAAARGQETVISDVPLSLAETDKQTDASLDFLLGLNERFPEDIKQSIIQADLYSPSSQALLYIATHVQEKLSKAMRDLMTEARHYSASTRARARGLPINKHAKAAKEIANTERAAIISRLKRQDDQKTKSKGGRPTKWNHDKLFDAVSKAVASLRQKNLQKDKRDRDRTLAYKSVAGEMNTTAESVRKLIGGYMKTDWDTMRSDWASDFGNGRLFQNGNNPRRKTR